MSLRAVITSGLLGDISDLIMVGLDPAEPPSGFGGKTKTIARIIAPRTIAAISQPRVNSNIKQSRTIAEWDDGH